MGANFSMRWSRIRRSPSACSSFRAITTSMSSIAPIRPGWICQQPEQAPAADADAVGDRRPAGRSRSRRRSRRSALGRTLAQRAGAASLSDRRAFADTGRPAPVDRPRRSFGMIVFPLVLPPAERGWPRRRDAQLQRRDAFLIHQCAGLCVGRADSAALTQPCAPISAGALDRRAAPSSRRISDAGRSPLRAHRHRADQWQLVHSPAQVSRRARSSCTATAISTGSAHAASLKIVSAPSPVMEATNEAPTYFLHPHA